MFVWYFESATWQICFYGLEHGLRIYGFRPNWSLFLQPEQNFWNHLVTALWSHNKYFWLLPQYYGPVWTVCVAFKSHSDAMQQLLWIPFTTFIASFMWYTYCKQACTIILQNFWLSFVYLKRNIEWIGQLLVRAPPPLTKDFNHLEE